MLIAFNFTCCGSLVLLPFLENRNNKATISFKLWFKKFLNLKSLNTCIEIAGSKNYTHIWLLQSDTIGKFPSEIILGACFCVLLSTTQSTSVTSVFFSLVYMKRLGSVQVCIFRITIEVDHHHICKTLFVFVHLWQREGQLQLPGHVISLLISLLDLCIFIFILRFYLFIFRDKGREGEREGKKHQCVVAPCVPPTEDLAHNLGMCPD